MNLIVKISWILFLATVFQCADSFPQFSIPFVSWRNKEESSRSPLNFRIQNPFSSQFGKNSPRQFEKTRFNNEVLNNNEKIITVTPSPGYYANSYDTLRTVEQTTQDPRIWGNYEEKNVEKDKDNKEDKQNLENKIIFRDDQEEQVSKFDFSDDDVNKITTVNDITTESTTEYETTTDYDDLFRSGVSGHVVATLLG